MNKEDLVTKVRKDTGKTKACVEQVVNAFLVEAMKGLVDDGEVRMYPLGKLKVKERKGRIGTNPNTGEKIEIKAVNQAKFIASSDLKDALNENR